MAPICVKKIFEERGLVSPCRCPRCQELKTEREKTGTPPAEKERKTNAG